MNRNEKFHQDELNVSMEISDEALEDVSGGASANRPGLVCRYCGRDDSFVWASFGNGVAYRYCTACEKVHY